MGSWNLVSRLLKKNFGALGDRTAEAIAAFDPDTATQVDRDALVAKLREVGERIHEAQTSYNKELSEVETLKAAIARDEHVLAGLAEKLASGEVSESVATQFCDELEQNRARLPVELAEAEEAKKLLEEYQSLFAKWQEQLQSFTRNADEAKRRVELASARNDLASQKLANQQQLKELGALHVTSSAISALNKRAAKMETETAGISAVVGLGESAARDAANLQQLRDAVSGKESLAERLKRLSTPAAATN